MGDRRDSAVKLLDRLARRLSKAVKLQDLQSIRVEAEAARRTAEAVRLGIDAHNRAAEIRVRAERLAGQLLREAHLRGGDRRSSDALNRPKLAKFGISANDSTRWQRVAAVSDEVLEGYIAAAKRLEQAITFRGLMQAHRAAIKRGGGEFMNRSADRGAPFDDDGRII